MQPNDINSVDTSAKVWFIFLTEKKAWTDNMVVWTDQERACIQDIFSKLNYEDAGPKALQRYGTHVIVLRETARGSWQLQGMQTHQHIKLIQMQSDTII